MKGFLDYKLIRRIGAAAVNLDVGGSMGVCLVFGFEEQNYMSSQVRRKLIFRVNIAIIKINECSDFLC